jgi:hypothetical protein
VECCILCGTEHRIAVGHIPRRWAYGVHQYVRVDTQLSGRLRGIVSAGWGIYGWHGNRVAEWSDWMRLLLLLGLLLPAAVAAQQVSVPYSGSAPYSGSMSITVNVTGLPSGCVAGAPSYANGTITVAVNCGVIPPPVGTTCASSTTPVTGCMIGSTVAVVSNPGNVRGTPAAGGGNGPLMGTQPGGATGVIVSNPVPQTTPATGWQVVNFGAGTCNAAGPYSATCGYVGNNNLKPATAPPPTAPTVACTPTTVQIGGTVACASNQSVTWSATAGSITQSGVLTAPTTPQTMTVKATNANGTGTAPITVTSTVATCAVTLNPSGGQDTPALLVAIAKAGSGCVELKAGTYNLSAWTPPIGTSLVLDDAVVIQDFGIFGRTTPFFNVTNKLSVVGAGPLYSAVVTMPTNYANAKKQVANGQDYEYQHCFALNGGVSGVVFSNFSLLNCAGDGVTFVSTSGATLTNINSATNIRQGMAVTGPATNVSITGGNLHDGPLSSFDCEPDAGITGNIQLTLTNVQSNNNAGGGFSMGLMNLTPATTVNIIANGITSNNDGGIGIAVWNRNSGVNANAVGQVLIENFSVTNAKTYGTGGNKSTDGYSATFKNGTIKNTGQAALRCSVAGGETGTPGGIAWSGITITGIEPSTSFASNIAKTTVTNSTYNGANFSFP